MGRNRASRPQAKPVRLFVAVEVPIAVREQVAAAVAPWRERHPRARWVPQNNQHVTVRFLGATWPRLLEWVKEAIALAAAGAAPFESRVRGFGAFPSATRARVLWAGLDEAAGSFASVADGLERALAREFEPEKRAFAAHLTVARFDPPVGLEGLNESHVESEPFVVERVILFRSHLRRPAPVYEPLAYFPLGG